MTRAARIVGALLLLALLGAAVAWAALRRPRIGAVERGRRVAEATGCFACHGPGGVAGLADAAEGIAVPGFGPADLADYARDESEIREWIVDGAPRRIREQAGDGEESPLLVMPAFRGRLDEREVSDLVEYVKAVGDFGPPPPGDAGAGREAAARLGCFSCHGPQGRGALPNAGSFKGYVPPWDGEDFADLARDDGEVREWILDGSPARLREHRVARFFLDRQAVKMPSYRGRITEAELQQVTAYLRWLRTPRG